MTRPQPYWWAPAKFPDPASPSPTDATPSPAALPAECDVLVIGAGHTGLSAARTLASRGRSAVVLDKEVPGYGASSRNGGMIGGGHRLSVEQLESRFGAQVGHRMLKEAHVEALAFARSVIEDEGIDCDFKQTGRFRGLWLDSEYETSARELERLQAIFDLDAWMVPQARQREEVATDLYAGGTVYAAHGALNPAKYVLGLLAAARRAGAQVFGQTPATGVERSGSGFVVDTPAGKIRAGQVLVATNGYTDGALPWLRRRIVPIPSFIVATEELGENRLRDLFPTGRMVAESRERHCYFRPSPDYKRLIFGGRAAMFPAPDGLAQSELRRLMTEVFPQLGDVTFEHSWSGRTGFSFNFMPNVGERDGIWHAMGYSGSGNAMAPYLGHKVALQMLGDSEGDTAFTQTPFDGRFWHPGKPWFLPFADVFFRLRDRQANARKRK